MESRHPQWQEIPEYSKIFNFKWKPISAGIRFEQLSQYGSRQIVNHIENHEEISMKDNLFNNLSVHWVESKLNVFDYVPLTFVLEYDSDKMLSNLTFFNRVFDAWKNVIDNGEINSSNSVEFDQELFQLYRSHNRDFKLPSRYKNIWLPQTHLEKSNLWFLKVTKLNRGRGIYVFSTVEQLLSLINECTESIEGTTIIKADEDSKNNTLKDKKCGFVKVPKLGTSKSTCVQDYDPNTSNGYVQSL